MHEEFNKEEVTTLIKEQIAGNPILLYMKGDPEMPQCGFSNLAVQLLKACGKPFAYVDILSNPEIRATLPEVANWPTFPQLYIQGELIGGSDIMKEMYEEGELQDLLDKAVPTDEGFDSNPDDEGFDSNPDDEGFDSNGES